MLARDVMTPRVISIEADAPIMQAAQLMLQNRISGLPVAGPKGELVGMVTEGDFLRRGEIGTRRHRSRWLEFMIGPGRLAEEYVRACGRTVHEVMTRDPLTITDAFSRYLICCQAGSAGLQTAAHEVWTALTRAFGEYGMPAAIRVDNGQPWVAPKGALGITRLAVWIMKADIALERIDPGKPQQNGRHERFHLTLHQETACPPAMNIRAQQFRFNSFQRKYNEERPHEALRQRPPAKVYVPSQRRFTERLKDPTYPSWFEVLTPSIGGHVQFRGSSWFISDALGREQVGFVEVEEDCFELFFGRLRLGRIHVGHPDLGLLAA